MQTRAIMEAACNVKNKGVIAIPNIMIPLIGTKAELDHQSALVRKVAQQVQVGSPPVWFDIYHQRDVSVRTPLLPLSD